MNFWLVILPLIPLLAAPVGFALAQGDKRRGYWFNVLTPLVCLALSALFLLRAWQGQVVAAELPVLMARGLTFRADGFRALYAAILSFMWLMTALFCPEYLAHGHRQGRYILFTLLTLGGALGVFLSDDLYTALVFFEIMSLASYPWVAHEENPAAMRAATTYLAIAVFGGMAALLGLIMLQAQLGTLAFPALAEAAHHVSDKGKLLVPGLLILTGFGAKAGLFPLHVWLPKSHPVAPAPASALLSGALTKVGVFGILVLTARVFSHDAVWGQILLVLGVITMVGGAVLAVFSVDLKRTLACSSMSQIGFITVGAAMQALLGHHNSLAAMGTVLHMVNHSLIKLVLFMAAGVIYMKSHTLDLNALRGYGRKKPLLMVIFAIGAASISGLPFFSGYASKTLLHESLLEYAHLEPAGLAPLGLVQTAEWLFTITGGLTFAYMLKLFVCLFVEKHPSDQDKWDAVKPSMNLLSTLALGSSALLLFVLGIWPNWSMDPLARLSLPFLGAEMPEHAVHYLAGVNLLGLAKSLVIGLVVYLIVIRRWLAVKEEGALRYLNRWPKWLDMENSLYRPLVSLLTATGTLLARSQELLAPVAKLFLGLGTLIARVAGGLLDDFVAWVKRVLLVAPRQSEPVPVGNRFTYTLGTAMDKSSMLVNGGRDRQSRGRVSFTKLMAALWDEVVNLFKLFSTSLSFSLMMFAIGLVVTMVYLFTR